jgi:hypothetical protein
MNNSMAQLKRLALPIAIGVFALVMGVLGVLYIMEGQTQNAVEADMAAAEAKLYAPFVIDEELISEYNEKVRYIPVVSNTPNENALSENEFKERVISLILDHANNATIYPYIVVEPQISSNIDVKSSTTSTTVKVQSSNYRIYTFSIIIDNIDYDQTMKFIENISVVTELQTLVIETLTSDENGATIGVSVYTRVI